MVVLFLKGQSLIFTRRLKSKDLIKHFCVCIWMGTDIIAIKAIKLEKE